MKYIPGLFFLLILSSCYFFGPSSKKRLAIAGSVKPIDVAIVPGLPLHNGKWDTLLKARMLWAEFLYKKGYVRKLLFSGNAVYTPWIEGNAMSQYALQMGIHANDILIDTLAEHSTENLVYGYRLAKAMGYHSIAFATDPFQCAMLFKYSKKHIKENIYFIPIIDDSISTSSYLNLFIDTVLTKKKNFVPIVNKQDYKTRLDGTRGKNIQE